MKKYFTTLILSDYFYYGIYCFVTMTVVINTKTLRGHNDVNAHDFIAVWSERYTSSVEMSFKTKRVTTKSETVPYMTQGIGNEMARKKDTFRFPRAQECLALGHVDNISKWAEIFAHNDDDDDAELEISFAPSLSISGANEGSQRLGSESRLQTSLVQVDNFC